MRDELLAVVKARLDRFAESNDPSCVLDPEALREVGQLFATSADPERDLEVREVAGRLHWYRYLAGGGQRDLATARHFGAPEPADAARFGQLAINALQEAMRSADPGTLEKAIVFSRQAVAAAVPDDPDRMVYLANLCTALGARFEQTGDLSALDEAIGSYRTVTTMVPPNDGRLGPVYTNLGAALVRRYELTREETTLDEAIRSHRAAVELAKGSANHGSCLNNLGGALRARFELTGDLPVLDEAIDCARRVAGAIPDSHSRKAGSLTNLGSVLLARFERTGDLAALHEAIRSHRAATAITARPKYLSNLGTCLSRLFGRTGDRTVLDEAIDVHRRAVATGADDPERPVNLSNLGTALTDHYNRTGNLASLDEAIRLHRLADAATPDGHLRRRRNLSNLADSLRLRFERTGELAVLDESVDILRQTVAATPDDHPDLALHRMSLGSALTVRANRTGEVASQDEAVEVLRAAVAAIPDDQHSKAGFQANLGNALCARFDLAGDPEDLQEAAGHLRHAAAGDDARAGFHLSALGLCLRAQFEQNGDPAALREAVDVGRRAVVAVPADQPDSVGVLSNLARTLEWAYEHTREPGLLTEVMHIRRKAVGTSLAAPSWRVSAGIGLGQLALSVGDIASAVEGFTTAVELLPQVAARHLGRGDAEHWLASYAGLASLAAASALAAGDAERAVELLEQGRGVLLAQALDSRSDLTDLRDHAPELADRFEVLCVELDVRDDVFPTAEAVRHDTDPAAASRATDRRRDLARELDTLVADIRRLPDFENFMRPAPISQLAATTSGGPVVLVNISALRCDALILTTGGVQVVELGELTEATVHEQVAAFGNALVSGPGVITRWRAEQKITEVLAWLWDTVAEPVLTALGFTTSPGPDEAWPQIWWVPTGPLSALPLHAAGHHVEKDRQHPRTVLDRVVSSYTPTVRALGHARARRPGSEPPRLLVVAMPRTPDADDLPGAQREAALLQHGVLDSQVLSEADATRAAVLAELPDRPWAHFACHGHSDLNNPSASHLLVHDHPLRVSDIARLRLHHAELAYLSACSTAATNPQLADEAIHITSAFQLAGYPHVIGTLWTIGDTVAVEVAEQVYTTLTAGTPDMSRAALAVHHATRHVRGRHPSTPSLWAAHIHAGA